MKVQNNIRSKNSTTEEVSSEFFVVTRDKRRTSDWNFTTEQEARAEAAYWINICKKYDPASKVSIVKTHKPRKIR